MKKLISLRKIILIIGICLSLIASVVFLIFGEPEGKFSTMLAAVIAVPLFYAFIWLMFYILNKNKTKKLLILYSWLFMIGGIIAILTGVIYFFNPFPANTLPFISIGFTLVVSVLYGYDALNK